MRRAARSRDATFGFARGRVADVSPTWRTIRRRATANEAVNWADAFVLASPDYHGSMSGAMKNFLDYYWTEFAGKIFGYLCASHEKGLTPMDQMRTAVRQCYGWSLPYGVSFHGSEDFDADGNIANDKVLLRLQILARDIVVYGGLISDSSSATLKSDGPTPSPRATASNSRRTTAVFGFKL